MRIVTHVFETEHTSRARGVTKDAFDRLLVVFEKSARACMPGSTIVTVTKYLPNSRSAEEMHAAAYAAKPRWWEEEVKMASGPFMLADCDLMFLRPVNSVLDYSFDVAITRRDELDGRFTFPETLRVIEQGKWAHLRGMVNAPFNTGVMFVRPNDRSRQFFQLWADTVAAMTFDRAFYMKWKKKYLAIDQAALGYLIETGGYNAEVISLPCSSWNSCESSWGYTDKIARVVHIKRELRQKCLGLGSVEQKPRLKFLVDVWKRYEKA